MSLCEDKVPFESSFGGTGLPLSDPEKPLSIDSKNRSQGFHLKVKSAPHPGFELGECNAVELNSFLCKPPHYLILS